MHKPVLLKEVLDYLNPQPGDNFIDATFGGGGHTIEILKRIAPDGKLLGIDWDPIAVKMEKGVVRGEKGKDKGSRLETGSENLIASEPLLVPTDTSELIRSGIEFGSYFAHPSPKATEWHSKATQDKSLRLVHGNFADITAIASRLNLDRVDGVLFDFGFSSNQLAEGERGFSYLRNEPLDMRFYRSETSIDGITAEKIVNDWREEELERIFREFGEERDSRKIAKAIAEAGKRRRILTTGELVEILDKTYGTNRTKSLSRIFQALRIAVNNELENIKQGLAGAWQILKPGGRIGAISFHSLEDRIVKNFFNEKKQMGEGQILTKKPITASDEEISNNNRSRSAKLRAIRKL